MYHIKTQHTISLFQDLSIILNDDRLSHLARQLSELPVKQTKMLNTPFMIQTLKLTRNATQDAPLILSLEDKVRGAGDAQFMPIFVSVR